MHPPLPGRPLSGYYRAVAALVRRAYFRRVQVHADPTVTTHGPRLVISSHRNGALDGYVVLAAFPRAQFLVSVQLLRQRLLRALFSGIPVVRDKDRARYGLERSSVGNPVDAGVAHLRAGGDLVVFPEGTSEWGPHPLPYQKGAARMARALLEAGQPFSVVPLGLHYPQPDRWQAGVDLVMGPPVALPARAEGESDAAWEGRLHAAMGAALDAVSVHCPDPATFEAVEAHAQEALAQGKAYGPAFLAAQAQCAAGWALESNRTPVQPGWLTDRFSVAMLWVAAWPMLGLGLWAGRRADARNTVSFFQVLGGLAGALVMLPLWSLALWHWPLPSVVTGAFVALGWWRYPAFMQPWRR